jgi:RHS repeat-associated protein
MKAYRKDRKYLILLLVVMLVLMNIPNVNQSASAETSIQSQQTNSIQVGAKERHEIKNKRTANSKTFANSNGTFTTEISQTPIHYKDNTNQWKDINNDLMTNDTEEVYQNKSNSMKVKFNQEQEHDTTILEIEEKNKSLKMELQPLEHTGEIPKTVKGIVKENHIRYEEVYTNIALNYSVGSDRVKEDIVYKKKPTNGFPEKFTYKMNLEGMYIKEVDGIIFLYDQVSKKQLFYFDAPYMYDATLPKGYKAAEGIQSVPEESMSYDVDLDYEVKDEQLYLTLYPNTEWLNDSKRVYPITIDPTIVRLQSSSYVEDTNIRSGFPTQTGGNDLELGGGSSSGNIIRSLLKFDLTSIPDSEILSADLNLWFSSTNGSNPINLSLHRMTKDWTENQASWNYAKTVPSTVWTTKGGDFISAPFATITGLTTPGTLDTSSKKWEIPVSIVQGWISNRSSNYGVVLKSDTESTNIYKKFISSENTVDSKYHPLLVVSYKAPSRLGLESYWEYSTHPLIDGTSYINLTTGNNILEYKDLNIIKKNEGVEFTRIYNSKSVESSAFGKGWTFTGNDSLLEKINTGDIVYTDSDGTSHNFTYNSANNTYLSPKGKYLSLKKVLIDGVLGFEMKNKYGFKSYFKVYSNQNDQSIKMYRIEYTLDKHSNKYLYKYANLNSNKLTAIIDPSNYTMNIIYDTLGQKIIEVNYKNEKINYGYDSNGRLSVINKYLNGVKSSSTLYNYNQNGYIYQVINPNGKITTFTYLNEFLQNIKEESSLNDITQVTVNNSFEYDILNKTATVTYPDNTEATFFSNDNYVPIKVIHIDGTETTFKLDDNYNPLEIIDSEGKLTINKFDSLGNMINSSYDSLVTTYQYDTNNNRLSENDPEGSIRYTYNPYGDLLESADSVEGITSYTYDLYGNMLTKTNPNKSVESYEYKPSNQIQTTYLDETSNSFKVTKDINDNIIETVDSNGNITKKEYDINNNLISVLDANQNQIRYVYDSMGRKTSYIDKKGKEEKYKYNQVNQLTEITNPLNQTISLTYDINSKLNKIIYPKGNNIGYTYTEQGKLDNIFWNNVLKWDLTYNTLGQLERINNNQGEVISYTYDIDGNLSTESNDNTTKKYFYSDQDLLTDTEFNMGMNQTKTHFVYNSNNEVGKIVLNNNEIIDFQYDNLNNPIKIENSNGTNNEYTYNAKGHLTEIKTITDSGAVLNSYANTYDNNGNIIQVQSKSGIKTYQYDKLNQLISESINNNHTISYEYDENGNRIKKNSTINGATQSETYSYNAANQLIEVNGTPIQNDTNGNIVNDGENEYTYNEENKLVSVRNLNNNKFVSFSYDFQGKRSGMEIDGNGKYYYYDGDNITLETDGVNIIAEYFWSKDGKPVAMSRNNVMYYYHLNSHGDVEFITDGNANEVARYEYDAWGNILSQSGSLADVNPIRYAGYYFDNSTNLYYLGQRYYNPKTGRFITQDIWYGEDNQPNTKNKYTYGNNNPVFFVDPNGQFAVALVVPAAALAFLLALAANPNIIEDLAIIIDSVITSAREYKNKNDNNKPKYLDKKAKKHIKERHFKDYPAGPDGKGTLFPKAWSEKFIFDKIFEVANKKIITLKTPKYWNSKNAFKIFPVAKSGYACILLVSFKTDSGRITSGYPKSKVFKY